MHRNWNQLSRLAVQLPDLPVERVTALLFSIDRSSAEPLNDAELVAEARLALSGAYSIPQPRRERRFQMPRRHTDMSKFRRPGSGMSDASAAQALADCRKMHAPKAWTQEQRQRHTHKGRDDGRRLVVINE